MSLDNDIIFLPVSLGESIDKLTILDIKLEKIKDGRRDDVQKEYDLLYEKLKQFIIKYENLYETMKKVNLLIWDMMDLLRDGELDEINYLKICRDCIEYNDIRFRVKNKINYISNSLLKEQKSYKINRILIEINDNIVNISEFFKPIKYYSFIYDEIIIFSKNNDLKNEFSYDKTIIFEEKKYEKDEYKKIFYFSENDCDKEKIYKLFDLNENDLKKF
jgi:hypothetical protein